MKLVIIFIFLYFSISVIKTQNTQFKIKCPHKKCNSSKFHLVEKILPFDGCETPYYDSDGKLYVPTCIPTALKWRCQRGHTWMIYNEDKLKFYFHYRTDPFSELGMLKKQLPPSPKISEKEPVLQKEEGEV